LSGNRPTPDANDDGSAPVRASKATDHLASAAVPPR
jgi:hypothetical protein